MTKRVNALRVEDRRIRGRPILKWRVEGIGDSGRGVESESDWSRVVKTAVNRDQ